MATLEARNEAKAGFEHWLEAAAERPLKVALKRDHGQWYAQMLDFDIAGMGATQKDAVHEAFDLLGSYLRAYFEDGKTFEDALRPIPTSERIKLQAEVAIASAIRHISESMRISVSIPFSSESKYQLPPGALSDLVHC